MTSTTFDYAKALAGNHATSHAPDVDGKPSLAVMELNYSIIPLRPAGAGWSNIRDMLKYVQMELNEGTLPDGIALHQEGHAAGAPGAAGADRQGHHVRHGPDGRHGVRHAGRASWRRHDRVSQRHDVAARAQRRRRRADQRGSRLDPADAVPPQAARGAVRRPSRGRRGRRRAGQELLRSARRRSEAADDSRGSPPKRRSWRRTTSTRRSATSRSRARGAATVFDMGEWQSEVATRHNPDGSLSFITIAPGISGFEFVVGSGPKPSLIVRDAQHEYMFWADTPSSSK